MRTLFSGPCRRLQFAVDALDPAVEGDEAVPLDRREPVLDLVSRRFALNQPELRQDHRARGLELH
jgi:hypothetical protein